LFWGSWKKPYDGTKVIFRAPQQTKKSVAVRGKGS